MPARWSDALAHARAMAADCLSQRGGDVLAADLPWWALPVYVIAYQQQTPVTAVTAAELRYRLDDRDTLLTWLYHGLTTMGYAVDPPVRTCTDAGEADALLAWLPHGVVTRTLAGEPIAEGDRQLLPQHGHHADDDPVVGCWRWGSTIVCSPEESSDGLTYPGRPSCALWDRLPEITALLDEHLITVRGGWPAGARVTVSGPPYTLLGEFRSGVFGNRARVLRPLWALDHDAATLQDGPPVGYWLAYRSKSLSGADHYPPDPVPADRLGIDLGPLHQDRLDEAAAARPAPATNAPPSAGTRTAAFQSPRSASAARRPRSISATDPAEQYRTAALQRLWSLRDDEIMSVRDSTPRRIAERIVKGSYPPPPDPPTDMDLRQSDFLSGELARIELPRPPRHQLVTGDRRRYLLQWLPEVTSEEKTSRKQRQHLDGLDAPPTFQQLRQFLADEGFVEIADVRDNAGPAPEPCRSRSLSPPDPPSSRTDQPILLLMCHPTDAQLASLRTWPSDSGGWCRLRIHFCIEPLDTPLFEAGIGISPMWPVYTSLPVRLWHGTIGSDQAGSMRVRLTVLRAFTRPVVPWPAPVPLRVLNLDGSEDQPADVIAGLPTWVHDLFPMPLSPQR